MADAGVDERPLAFQCLRVELGNALGGGIAAPIEVKVEAQLYAPTLNFISLAFGDHVRRRAGSGRPLIFPEHVDHAAGDEGGRWTRPDLACLAIVRGEFVPYWRADLHTFEVKTASGLNVTAIHEANAHGRLGQFAWLAFQAVGPASADTNLFGDMLAAAGSLGVGVLTFRSPGDPEDWRIEQWPTRTNTDPAVADAFVRERFSATSQAAIRKLLDAHGWRDMGAAHDGL